MIPVVLAVLGMLAAAGSPTDSVTCGDCRVEITHQDDPLVSDTIRVQRAGREETVGAGGHLATARCVDVIGDAKEELVTMSYTGGAPCCTVLDVFRLVSLIVCDHGGRLADCTTKSPEFLRHDLQNADARLHADDEARRRGGALGVDAVNSLIEGESTSWAASATRVDGRDRAWLAAARSKVQQWSANRLAAIASQLTLTERGPCFEYGPRVAITGTLRRMTFPGPPNFDDVKRGDRPETGFYVQLDTPICAAAANDGAIDHEARVNVTLVETVLNEREYARYRSLVGTRVSAEGVLFSSHTGHHHAPLLLEKVTLRPAK